MTITGDSPKSKILDKLPSNAGMPNKHSAFKMVLHIRLLRSASWASEPGVDKLAAVRGGVLRVDVCSMGAAC